MLPLRGVKECGAAIFACAERPCPRTACLDVTAAKYRRKWTAMARVFISHSSRDGDQAERLHKWLRDQGSTETFLDIDKHAGLMPGDDWERRLYREIAASEAVILILTRHWLES